jgi:hypothetical protein
MVIKYPKCQSSIPNGHKIYQHFPIEGPPKFTQIGIFGSKETIWQPCSGEEKKLLHALNA